VPISAALTAPNSDAGINARERIDKEPWRNAKGAVIARNVEHLHSKSNNITK
jgi:hypothetical protein